MNILNLFNRQPKQLLLEAPLCSHSWNLFSKTYAAPKPANEHIPESSFERVIFGVTTFLWECMNCGTLRQEQALGSDDSQLAEVLDKAERLGIQYINYNGKRFGIALVPQGEGNVPLR